MPSDAAAEPREIPMDGRPPHPLAGIRHDLSSPLTVIRGHGQLLRMRLAGLEAPAAERERIDGHLDAIEAALDRIEAMLFPEAGARGRSGPDGEGAAGER